MLVLALIGVLVWAFWDVSPQRFVGEDATDSWGTQWFYWLIGRRILDGEPFAQTDLLFHPWGKDVYLHSGGNVLDAVLALPFRYVLGPVRGYNVFVGAILLANAAAGAWLARTLGARGPLLLLAGLIAGLSPSVLGELDGGRPTQALVALSLLAMASCFRLEEDPRPARAAMAGLWLALAGLNYWFHAIFVVLALAGALPGAVWRLRASERLRPFLFSVLGAVLVSLVVALPLAWPMLQGLGESQVPGLLLVQDWSLTSWRPETREGVLIGLETLHLPSLDVSVHTVDGAVPLRPGLAWVELLVLVGALFIAPARTRGLLLGAGLPALLLALGPEPGDLFVDPLYVLASKALPPLQRLWWPARALMVLHGLAGAAAVLLIAKARPLARLPLGAAVLALMAWDARSLLPLRVISAEIPELYRCLAQGEGSLLEIPFDGQPQRLHFQAVHNRPLFGGMIDDNPVFAPEEHRRARAGIPLLQALADPMRPELGGPEGMDQLVELGVAYVVVDLQAATGLTRDAPQPALDRGTRQVRARMRALLGEPITTVDGLALYGAGSRSDPCD